MLCCGDHIFTLVLERKVETVVVPSVSSCYLDQTTHCMFGTVTLYSQYNTVFLFSFRL